MATLIAKRAKVIKFEQPFRDSFLQHEHRIHLREPSKQSRQDGEHRYIPYSCRLYRRSVRLTQYSSANPTHCCSRIPATRATIKDL
jgi:hypothetical protein